MVFLLQSESTSQTTMMNTTAPSSWMTQVHAVCSGAYTACFMLISLLFCSFRCSVLAAAPSGASATSSAVLLAPIRAYIEGVQKEVRKIPNERKQKLKEIALFIQAKLASNEPAQLVFICTHNSRRSHMSQIWAQTLAAYFGLQGVTAFSAGTEVTAFNERAVSALQRAGFAMTKTTDDSNPVYTVRYANNREPITAFSKLITDAANPQANFCAVMNCASAEQACPIVPGAALRVSIPYDDPKNFDGMPQEAAKYDERCRQIAREMTYLFSQIRIR